MGEKHVAELNEIFSADQIQADPAEALAYAQDWTRFFPPRPAGVCFPESAEQIQKLVYWARKHKIALVPSGGRTGLSGGAVAYQGEWVVSLERMNKQIRFSPLERTLRVQAGMITQQVQEIARENGYFFPVDFAAKGSSHIGGNVATNAGGVKVVRYGLTRDWVTGLQVVTGRGEILELNRNLVKNATGYDLRHLMIGSEGTLGFITEVELRLTTAPQDQVVFLLALEQLENAMSVFQVFRDRTGLSAFEFFSDQAMEYVLQSTGRTAPLNTRSPFYLLIETDGANEEQQARALEAFENASDSGWVVDGLMSQSAQQAQDLWALRENISEAISPRTPYKNDISVAISKVPQFVVETDQIIKKQYPDFEVIWFGHIGDGNLHINILKPQSMDKSEFYRKCQSTDQLLFKKIEEYGGAVSAEHGLGLIKKPYLHFSRSQAEIDLMVQIKKAFDPDLILNPGKTLDISPN